MSDTAWAFVMADVLSVAAELIAGADVAGQALGCAVDAPIRESVAHAIPKAELRAGRVEVVAVARCGRWPAAELARDDRAEGCLVCARTVERLDHRWS